jgi:uncharacterized OB-fold protein
MTNERKGVSPVLFNIWRHADQFKRFIGFECNHCHKTMFFPRRICNHCGEDTYFLGKGIIKSAVECSRNFSTSNKERVFIVDVEMDKGKVLAGIKYHGRDIIIGMTAEVRLNPNGNRELKRELILLPERKKTG